MNRSTLSWRLALAVLLASGALAACGGSDDDGPAVEPPPAQSIPPEARATAAGFTAWAAARPADDQADPLRVDDFVPPESETDEPAPLR